MTPAMLPRCCLSILSMVAGATALLAPAVLTPRLGAQEWSGEKLATEAAGFQSESLATKLEQIGALLEHRDDNFSAIVARIHGDHREYLLKIDRLIGELTDERWVVREQAERSLIEIGGRAKALILQHRDDYEFVEQRLRCARILDALTAKGTEEEDREQRLLRGLVQMALYQESEPRLLRALRSALGHTDPSVVEGAIRALGKLGGEDEVRPIEQMLDWKGGMHRQTTIAALARMQCDGAIAVCKRLLTTEEPSKTEVFVLLRALQSRTDDGARQLLGELAAAKNPLVAAGSKIRTSGRENTTPARFTLPDRSQIDARFGGFFGESLNVHDGFPGLAVAELAFTDTDTVEFPDHAKAPVEGTRVFLNQGSLVIGKIVAIDAESLKLESAMFGQLTLPRQEIQGLALDPELDRLVGASTDHDRLRLMGDKFLDGHIRSTNGEAVVFEALDGTKSNIPVKDIAGMLFTRPRSIEPDTTIYTRIDLTSGERLIAFVAGASGDELAITTPLLGSAVVPLAQVHRLELGVGGGALWGFTLVADYSDNRVVEFDDQGRTVFVLEDVFGAWDAECLDNGNLLITEFSVSRVQEINRKGEQVWVYEELKNPYDADRLPNGNTLIADTFGSRIVEVDPQGKEVWVFDQNIRPFDCDRLANGNTLIADVLKDRVIEVNQDGEVVWEVKNMPNVHDADRLPNGNTLVTLRNKGVVLELDKEGNTVWQLTSLSSPSDADRLPNGHTLVAENTQCREFDRRGNEVWKKETSWAVEVNRY